jgi:hypothetical protein
MEVTETDDADRHLHDWGEGYQLTPSHIHFSRLSLSHHSTSWDAAGASGLRWMVLLGSVASDLPPVPYRKRGLIGFVCSHSQIGPLAGERTLPFFDLGALDRQHVAHAALE